MGMPVVTCVATNAEGGWTACQVAGEWLYGDQCRVIEAAYNASGGLPPNVPKFEMGADPREDGHTIMQNVGQQVLRETRIQAPLKNDHKLIITETKPNGCVKGDIIDDRDLPK
jgi:hypothetical protein